MLYLHVRSGPAAGAILELDRQGARIGRDESCELRLSDNLVSKLHAEIFVDLLSGDYVIRDLGSRNGIRINGEATPEKRLDVGDEVQLGRTRIVCLDEPPARASLEGASLSLAALAELGRIAADADPLDSLDAYASRLRAAATATGAALAIFEEGVEKPLLEAHSTGDDPADPGRRTGKLKRGQLDADSDDQPDDEAPAPLACLIAEAARTRLPVDVHDAAERSDLAAEPEVRDRRVRYCLALPMVVDAALIGVAQVYRDEPGISPAGRAGAETATALIALALKRAL